MAWIESHQALKDHPKTFKLAKELAVSLPEVIGHLHCLWWWSLDYAPDGDLSRFEAEVIARGCLWEGDPKSFVNGLTEAGFLDRVDETMKLHDWEEYAGRFLRANSARQERALKANHARWHVSQGIKSSGCRFCSEEEVARNLEGIHDESIRTASGVDKESARSPQGVLKESPGNR